MSESVEIFFCYAHEDEVMLKNLKKHLKALHWQRLIKTWYDGEISGGTEWEQEIHKHLNRAQIILLLVSPDFIASDYCYNKEMMRAMERHERKEARVIPIMLRPVDYSGTPFSKLQALPKDALPITRWTHQDDALFDIAQTIRKVVEELISFPEQLHLLDGNTNMVAGHLPQPITTILPSNNQRTVLTCQISQEFMGATRGSQIAYILLEAKFIDPMAQVYNPFNIALVIDNSISMRGAKFKNVREAIKMIIDRLRPDDYISVITFSDTVRKIFPSTSIITKSIMKSTIDRIVLSDNETHRFMSLGMLAGLNELEHRREEVPSAISRMILLTDGLTSGDAESCRQIARDAAATGIPIYPMGIGSDWDENLLDDIGQFSGGMPAEFIKNPQDTLSIFAQQVQSSILMAMRNVMLVLRLPQGVFPRKVVMVFPTIYEIDRTAFSDRQIIVTLEDLEQDTSQLVLVELVVEPRQEGLHRVAQAELSFDIPLERIYNEKIRNDITVTFTSDDSKIMPISDYIMKYVMKIYNI